MDMHYNPTWRKAMKRTKEELAKEMLLIPGFELEDYIFRLHMMQIRDTWYSGWRGALRTLFSFESKKAGIIKMLVQELSCLEFQLYSEDYQRMKFRMIMAYPMAVDVRNTICIYISRKPFLMALSQPRRVSANAREVNN